MKVYVVTNNDSNWLVGVFTDKDYVYSKYNNFNYSIEHTTLDETKYNKNLHDNNLKKYGRTNYQYKVLDVTDIKEIDVCQTTFIYDDKPYISYNLIDPYEGNFIIEFNGIVQEHTIENLSLFGDILSEIFKINKDNIIIFKDKNKQSNYFLGSIEYFDIDSKYEEFSEYLKQRNINFYY